MNNAEFAKTWDVFLKCCELAKVKPTTRQASKFRSQKGRAYPFRLRAIRTLNGEEVTDVE